MGRAKDTIACQVDGVNEHVIDALQEGLTVQRYLLPKELGVQFVPRPRGDLLPPDRAGATP